MGEEMRLVLAEGKNGMYIKFRRPLKRMELDHTIEIPVKIDFNPEGEIIGIELKRSDIYGKDNNSDK